MISYNIFFIRIYRMRLGLAFCYAIGLVTLLMGVRIRYFRSAFDADGDDSDAKRVAGWRRKSSHETCHMSREGDALELLLSNVTMHENSIFFHETSCKGDLTSRQACVVESAAKAHPNHQINVFFTSAVSNKTLKHGCVSILYNYQNVKLARVLIGDYANGTPIASRVEHMPSDDINIHISKIMKFLTLYKYSGIYLSLDVIVARKFDLWKNWTVKESPYTLSSDMFAFSKNKVGRKLAQYALGILLNELAMSERRDLWSYGSPSVIEHLLEYWCSGKDVKFMELSKCNGKWCGCWWCRECALTCWGAHRALRTLNTVADAIDIFTRTLREFTRATFCVAYLAVYGPDLFYPIPFHDRKEYFQIVDWEDWRDKLIFTYFVWHRFTRYNLVTPGSLYGRIANEYCPMTYQRYIDDSGVWYPEQDGAVD